MFCVECGKEGQELVGSLCRECYAKKHIWARLPEHVDLMLCAHCSSMLADDRWVDVGSVKEAAEAALRGAVELPKGAKFTDLRVQLEEKDERNLDARVHLVIHSGGVDFPSELATVVRLKRGSCTECSKQQGSYYEAMIQLRGYDRSLDMAVAGDLEGYVKGRIAAMRKSSRGAFISRIDRVKGGLDFYISTAHAARAIAREMKESMCADLKESSSLWGRRDGEDIYRMTFLVRIPGFRSGDVIEYGGKEYLVRSMSKGVIHGFDLASGEERALRPKETSECLLSVPKARILRAVVLMETETELQLLDPEAMSPVDVRKPRGFVREGEQVRMVKTKLGTYALSDRW